MAEGHGCATKGCPGLLRPSARVAVRGCDWHPTCLTPLSALRLLRHLRHVVGGPPPKPSLPVSSRGPALLGVRPGLLWPRQAPPSEPTPRMSSAICPQPCPCPGGAGEQHGAGAELPAADWQRGEPGQPAALLELNTFSQNKTILNCYPKPEFLLATNYTTNCSSH